MHNTMELSHCDSLFYKKQYFLSLLLYFMYFGYSVSLYETL